MVFAVTIFNFGGAIAAPSLTLPFPVGEKWRCDQGNYDDPQGSTNVTHRSSNSMAYAWDFNLVGGEDKGKPIFVPADGTITSIKLNKGGFGNVIVIDYGDGSYGKFAHVLSNIPVKVGQKVYRGETVIGYVGGTGGFTPHIHYETQSSSAYNGQSVRSTFEDVPGNGIPREDNYYLRGGLAMFNDGEGWHDLEHNEPSSPFYEAYKAAGSYSKLGKPFDNGSSKYVHSWPDDSSHPDALFVQDFKTNNGKWSMIVYNEDLEKAFVVNDKILEFWTSHWGYADFGPPVELHKHLFLIVL